MAPASPRAYLIALLAVAAALVLALALRPVAGIENVDLVFLTAIIAVAVRGGSGPLLLACVLSVLAYNFFFIPPLYTFAVAAPTNLTALFFFLLVALVTSSLAARARRAALAADARATTTEALYAFSRTIAGITSEDELLLATRQRIGSMLGLDARLHLRDAAGELALEGEEANPVDLDGLRAAWPAEGATRRDALRLGRRLFLPLRTGRGLLGVAGLASPRAEEGVALAPGERRLLEALLDQAAVAIERVRLARERDEVLLSIEKERLRSALLSSLSHDLKTPLASITGAVTALREYAELYDPAARDELSATIQEEAERMTRFVANLLDMTRLEAGGITLHLEAIDLGEVIGTALRRSERLLAGHAVTISLDPGLPMLRQDVVLLEQVLVNLLDNAAKYAPPGSTVALAGRLAHGTVTLDVADEGPGLGPGDPERLFEAFYRANRGDRQRAGTGLGLAICRGFMQALGGAIRAGNRVDRGGAVFTLAFPATVFATGPAGEGDG